MAEFFHKVVGPIELSEHEMAKLMRLSNGRPLCCTFGSSVWLDADKSPWAVPILAQMRGLSRNMSGGVFVWGASEASS